MLVDDNENVDAVNSLIAFPRYFKEKRKNDAEEQDSDADSVTSEDFNSLLDKMSGVQGGGDEDDLDIAGGIGDLKALDSDDDDDEDMKEEDDDDDTEIAGDDGNESDSEPELDGENSDDSTQWDDIKDIGSGSEEDEEEKMFDEEAWENSDNNEEESAVAEPPSKTSKKTKRKAKKNEFDEDDEEEDELEGMDFNPAGKS